jgi:hypothetical protein
MLNSEGKIIKGQHPALISMELFQKCQQVRIGNTRNRDVKRLHLHPDFPLRRFALCGECTKPMCAAWSTGRTRKYGYYFCMTKGCSQYRKSIAKGDLEEAFYEQLKNIRPKPGVIEIFKELVIRQYQLQMRQVREQTDAVQTEIQTWRGQRKWLIEKAMEGIISDTVLKEQLKEVEDKLLIAELKAAEHTDQKCDVQSILDYAASFMQGVNNLWFDASFEDKLTYQKLVYPNGAVYTKDGFTNQGLSLPFEIIGELGNAKSPRVNSKFFTTKHFEAGLMEILEKWHLTLQNASVPTVPQMFI